MPDGQDRQIRRGRKFDQVLDGARDIFLSDGFEGASVDDIAKAAGVSKATLYSYFPDKSLLFMEVAKAECCAQASRALDELPCQGSIEANLRMAARQMVDFLTSEFGQGVFRIAVAESARFPEVGREFYENGPKLIRSRMTEMLGTWVERGVLEIEDLDLAADQFHALCKASIFEKMIFHLVDKVSDADKDRVIDAAVETFLARYGRKG